MNAVVVYESHWGNTAKVARAIAGGFGPGTPVLTTDEATPEIIADADLIVAGAPLMMFQLPTDSALQGLAGKNGNAAMPPDVSHPSMRDWLAALPHGAGRAAAFETRLRFSPGSAAGTIERGLVAAGYRRLAKGRRFYVQGSYGPLRYGELEAAQAWGKELATALAQVGASATRSEGTA